MVSDSTNVMAKVPKWSNRLTANVIRGWRVSETVKYIPFYQPIYGININSFLLKYVSFKTIQKFREQIVTVRYFKDTMEHQI